LSVDSTKDSFPAACFNASVTSSALPLPITLWNKLPSFASLTLLDKSAPFCINFCAITFPAPLLTSSAFF